MLHLGTCKLQSERLILRPFTMDDAEAMFKNWANSPEVTKYLTWQPHGTLEVTKQILSDWTSQYNDPSFYQWAIILRENGDEPVGCISVVKKDDKLKMVHIGYCIGQGFWHRGITSNAYQLVIDFMFNEVGVNRIESLHDPRNENSGKVMQKCGMSYEGTRRQAGINNLGICDCCDYAILAEDYMKNR